MNLKSYGHATLSIEYGNKPLIITDPWLIGSCYWRSWWLQHYPSDSDLSVLSKADNIFLTHEHWDHAHFPTLKKFFINKKIFIPKFNSKRLRDALKINFKVEEINPNEWIDLKGISYMSIPLYNDDSILLIKYDRYLICNINDSKPTPQIINKISEFKKLNDLDIILLQSYAPASINNSFRKLNAEKIIIKSKEEYINYVMRICQKLEAKYFVPFASQAVFSRPDSKWANEFKVTWNDLNNTWNVKTKLLKSYIDFNLDDENYDTYVSEYNKSKKMKEISNLKYNKNKNKEINFKDFEYFAKIVNPVKYLLYFIFPKGINFNLGGSYYKYFFLKKKFIKIENKPKNYIEMPVNEFIESSKNCQFTDLGTSFIMKIYITSKVNIFQTYLLFIFITFSEKGYFSNYKNFFKQIHLIFKNFFPKKIY